MTSKLRQTGFLMVDDRVSGGRLLEVDTKTCAHCQTVIMMNPFRTKERNWCSKCDKYICDKAECRIACEPIKELIDKAREAAIKGQPFELPKRFVS